MHYAVHEVLDVEHAAAAYAVLEAPFASDAFQRYQIEQGLELGAYLFLRLYRDLFSSRERRSERAIVGRHSATDGWYLPK